MTAVGFFETVSIAVVFKTQFVVCVASDTVCAKSKLTYPLLFKEDKLAKELIINSVESFEEALPLIQAAEKEFSTFTQEQVDTICEKAAMAVRCVFLSLRWLTRKPATVLL